MGKSYIILSEFLMLWYLAFMQLCLQDIIQAFELNRRGRRAKRSKIREYLLGGTYYDETTTEEETTSSDSDYSHYWTELMQRPRYVMLH